MKKALFTILLLMGISHVNASPYAGLYYLGGSTDTTSGSEINYQDPGAALVIGAKTKGQFGVLGEFGLSGEGAILTGAGYAMTGPVEWSLGVTAVPDSSDGQTRLGVDSSSEYGVGPIIGVRYKWISLRATRYDVVHNYNVTVKNADGEVVDSADSSSRSRREVYWAGVVIPF